jgi:catechol 2,3-dioxygenase-like lactoylglutathione lyase family enzyme
MALEATTIMIGVKDLARSKQFYADMGATIEQDYPHFVALSLGEGSSNVALYGREAAAQDAGVSPEGSGFRGVSFHFIVSSNEEVDEVMAAAVAAGGRGQGGGRHALGLLRVLQRPGRLPLEGRDRSMMSEKGARA